MTERTSRVIFDGEKARIKLEHFSVSEGVRIGAAAAMLFHGRVAVMASDRKLSRAKSAVVCGVGKAKCTATDAGMGFGALLSYAITEEGCDGGVLLTCRDDTCGAFFYDRYGMRIPFSQYVRLRDIYAALPEGELSADLPEENASRCPVGGYISRCSSGSLRGMRVHFESRNTFLNACAREFLVSCGAEPLPFAVRGCVSFSSDREGKSLWGRDETFRPISKNELSALLIKALADGGATETAYSYLSPTSSDNLCRLYGIEFHKVYDIASSDDSRARQLAASDPINFDALRAMGRLCAFLCESGSRLEKLRESIPCGVTKVQNIWIPRTRKDYVMRRLSGSIGQGARVSIMPCVTGGLRLMVEASDEESADELCLFYKNEIYRLAENADS